MNVGNKAGVVDTTYSTLGLPGSDLVKSPSSSEFLGDEEAASICPLLTPTSPAGIGYEQPLGVSTPDVEPVVEFEITDEASNPDISSDNFGKPIRGDETFDATTASVQSVESSSSSSSAPEPTACVQLLGPHHHYQQLTKVTDGTVQENGVGTIPLTFDQFTAGGEYCFTTWNWPLIRRFSAWSVTSVLIGMFCIAIMMIATLPQECEPEHMWWQGATVYEIFPASFQDSGRDGVGDLIGLTSRVEYLHSLGISAVRLNSVFHSQHYPEGYEASDSLTELHPSLGTLENMRGLIRALRLHNISLILDLAVNTMDYNSSAGPEYKDPVSNALQFWISMNVNGFYLYGLETLESGPVLEERIGEWRKVVGSGRPLIAPPGVRCSQCDLVHVSLDVNQPLQTQVEQAISIWPNVMWSFGHSGNQRLADSLPGNNVSIGALLLLMALPGTPSLLYGDEVGLKGVFDELKEHEDLKHMRQLAPMAWASSSSGNKQGFTDVMPWLPTAATLLSHESASVARVALATMASLRAHEPQLYMTTTFLAGEPAGHNFAIQYADLEGVVAIERWYPRRHVLVTISNLGPRKIQRDLSSLYYGGRVVVAYPSLGQLGLYIRFRTLILESGETLVVELDK